MVVATLTQLAYLLWDLPVVVSAAAWLTLVVALIAMVVLHRRARRFRRSVLEGRMSSEPVPPENVRLVMADGREVPADVVYLGWDDDDAAHVWEIVHPQLAQAYSFRVGVLPGRTAIIGPVRRPKGMR
jgi:hypothetical protein